MLIILAETARRAKRIHLSVQGCRWLLFIKTAGKIAHSPSRVALTPTFQYTIYTFTFLRSLAILDVAHFFGILPY